jgi:hypothetical protein
MPANYVDPYFKELFGGKTPQEVAAEITSLMPAAMADIDPAFGADYAPYTSKESIEKVVNTVASTPGASKKLFNYQTFGATNRDAPYLSGMAFGDEYGKPMVDYGLMTNVANEINKTGEKQFVLDNLPAIVVGYSEGYGGNLKDFVDAFPSIGFTQADMPAIEKGYNQGLKETAYIKSISTPFTIKHGFGSMISGALKTAQPILNNPLFQVAMAVYMPTIASSLGPYLSAIPKAYQTAVAGALASTAIQTAQGVPFETALKNATVNAVTSTGAPAVADYMLPYVGSTQVADALTSIGASAAKTAAMGGSKDDIEKNMLAGLTGSALASSLQGVNVSRETSRLAGATAGGAVVGGTAGAVGGFASEYGSQKAAADAALERAKKGLAAASGDTAFDTGQQLPENIVVGERERDPTLDTSIISPNVSVRGRQPDGTVVVTGKRETTPSLKEVTVTGRREPTIQDTDITLPVTTVTGKRETDDTLAEVTVRGKREEDTLPEVNVTGKREEEPIAETPVEEEPVVEDKGKPYRPNLFIYGGTKPSTLSRTLGTTVQNVPTASTTTGTSVGLGGRGEIESKESGKKRQTVWNEESLRLKDALGL